MTLRVHTLANGVRVVCDPMPGLRTLALTGLLTCSAPAWAAVSSTEMAYSGLFLKPSKKCSASKKTRFPRSRRNSIDSPTIARPSSSEALSAPVT